MLSRDVQLAPSGVFVSARQTSPNEGQRMCITVRRPQRRLSANKEQPYRAVPANHFWTTTLTKQLLFHSIGSYQTNFLPGCFIKAFQYSRIWFSKLEHVRNSIEYYVRNRGIPAIFFK